MRFKVQLLLKLAHHSPIWSRKKEIDRLLSQAFIDEIREMLKTGKGIKGLMLVFCLHADTYRKLVILPAMTRLATG